METQRTNNLRRFNRCALLPITPTTARLQLAAVLCLLPTLARAGTAVHVCWVQRDSSGTAIAVDGSNNVIVTGASIGSGGDYDFATIAYICVPSPVMTNLSGTNGKFQMRVGGLLPPGTLGIEASTNLAGWAPVFANTTPTKGLCYTDPEAVGHFWWFYRAFQFPERYSCRSRDLSASPIEKINRRAH